MFGRDMCAFDYDFITVHTAVLHTAGDGITITAITVSVTVCPLGAAVTPSIHADDDDMLAPVILNFMIT